MNHDQTIDTLRELGVAGVGTSHSQRMALLVIDGAGEPVSMGVVADRCGMSRASMTSIVDGLVDAKLVKRVHDLGDRRKVFVESTTKASSAITRAEAKAGIDNEVAA